MLKSFTAWLDEEVVDVGIIGIVETALSILAFGAVLSAVFGSSAIKATAVVVVILVFLGLFSLLAAERRQWRRKFARDERLLAHYCAVIKSHLDTTLHLMNWDDVATVALNGDTREVITLHGRVEIEKLFFFRLRVGPGWPQSAKQRKRVAYSVRGGVVGQVGGTRCDTTDTWLADGRLEVLVHLNSPAARGSEVRICVELDWPGMCAPLMKHREPDTFKLRFARQVDHARYVIVLPQGTDTYYEPVGFEAGESGFKLTRVPKGADQVEVELIAENLSARRQVGMRLDLK